MTKKTRNPRAPLLIGGVALLAAALGLYVAGPATRPYGGYALLAGALLILLWFVIGRSAAPTEAPRQPESMLFDPSTQMDDTRKD